jgi:ubiquinone biosynthesis protein COQ4
VRALIANPDDTAQAFRVIDALSGRAPERNLRRFATTPAGKRVLAQRGSLLPTLSDHERLAALPAGSLGRAYLAFMREEGISASGLVEASVVGADRVADADAARDDREVFDTWMRDSHDLWHTVTGYKGDLIGEASLLAFSFAQTRHPGVGLIVLSALIRTSVLGRLLGPASADAEPGRDEDALRVRRMIVQGFMRGARAEWLAAQDWEALLPQPLEDVRRELGLGDPPVYEPLRSDALGHGVAA